MLIWCFKEHLKNFWDRALARSPPLISGTAKKVHESPGKARELLLLGLGVTSWESGAEIRRGARPWNTIARASPREESSAQLRGDVDISLFPHNWVQVFFFLFSFFYWEGAVGCGGVVALLGGLRRDFTQ